jgi:60 kDa SS-A/Ro ribonucleoprotein
MAGDPKGAASLIEKHRIPREAIPSELLREAVVWEALLPSMGITALLRNLGNMAKAGLLEQDSEATRFVAAKVQNADVLKKGRVHPIAVLAALKVYESGKGVKGSGTWVANRRLVAALNEAFYLAYGAVQPSGKRIGLALDISTSMIGNKVAGMDFMTARELEAAITLVLLNTERDVDVVGFSHELVSFAGKLRPSTTLQEAVRIMQELPFGGTYCSLPIIDAAASGKDFDASVTMTDNETHDPHGVSGYLNAYRQKVGHRVTHSVLAFTAVDFTIGDPADPDVLNVAGFDSAVPQVLADFVGRQ